MPADGLAVDDRGAPSVGPFRPFALDDAGDPDADAEQPARVGARVAQDVGDAGADMGDDAVDVVPVLGQQPFGAGQFGEGEVEELDADPGLPDVDADQQPAVRGDPQQRTGRPPSESTMPASWRSPSAASSATTLLMEPELSPVAGPSS